MEILSFRDEPHTSSVFLLWWLCWHTWLCDLRNLSVYQMLSSLSRYMWVLCAMAIAISSIRIWHLMYWMLLLCLWCKVVEKLCVVMIPTVVNCCQLCQALSKCFCVFANCEIVSCFAEISFLQCKPDAEEWVPYTIAVQVLASLHLCHHAHPHVLKTQCNNNINSTTQLYMIKKQGIFE